jgi:hypothetical protein
MGFGRLQKPVVRQELLVLSAATVKIGSFMFGGKENADRSKEVWPRTERIVLFQVFPNLKDAA